MLVNQKFTVYGEFEYHERGRTGGEGEGVGGEGGWRGRETGRGRGWWRGKGGAGRGRPSVEWGRAGAIGWAERRPRAISRVGLRAQAIGRAGKVDRALDGAG